MFSQLIMINTNTFSLKDNREMLCRTNTEVQTSRQSLLDEAENYHSHIITRNIIKEIVQNFIERPAYNYHAKISLGCQRKFPDLEGRNRSTQTRAFFYILASIAFVARLVCTPLSEPPALERIKKLRETEEAVKTEG